MAARLFDHMSVDLQNVFQGCRVCVTGGAGFIGSHLTDALVSHGADVCVLDDFSQGRDENLAQIADRVRIVRGSILDSDALGEACADVELIFHLAALTSVPGSIEKPREYYEVNATGTLGVLEIARVVGARRVIFAASSSVYGDNPALPKVESMPPEPMSPYAVAKCASEYMLRAYSQCYGLSAVSLRYFNIFGPRQRPDSPYAAVVPRFAEALSQGRKPTIYGDGSQTRDFTHVSNAVHANLLAGACPTPLHGEVVNVACGKSYNLLELVERMAAILGSDSECEFLPPRVGEVLHSCASIQAARSVLGYEPVMNFDEGLRDALAFYNPVREREVTQRE